MRSLLLSGASLQVLLDSPAPHSFLCLLTCPLLFLHPRSSFPYSSFSWKTLPYSYRPCSLLLFLLSAKSHSSPHHPSSLCFCSHLDPRRVALSPHFTSYMHRLQHRMTSLLSLHGTQLLIFMSDFPLNCLHLKLQLYLTPAHFLVHSTSSKLFIKNKTLTCQYPDIFWVSR